GAEQKDRKPAKARRCGPLVHTCLIGTNLPGLEAAARSKSSPSRGDPRLNRLVESLHAATRHPDDWSLSVWIEGTLPGAERGGGSRQRTNLPILGRSRRRGRA